MRNEGGWMQMCLREDGAVDGAAKMEGGDMWTVGLAPPTPWPEPRPCCPSRWANRETHTNPNKSKNSFVIKSFNILKWF